MLTHRRLENVNSYHAYLSRPSTYPSPYLLRRTLFLSSQLRLLVGDIRKNATLDVGTADFIV